jgi:hypothetical protein
VLFHVLKHHLLLLNGLEASLPDVSNFLAEPPIRRSGQMVRPPLALATRLNQAVLHKALEPRSGVSFRLLNDLSSLGCRQAAVEPELVENEELVERERPIRLSFFAASPCRAF